MTSSNLPVRPSLPFHTTGSADHAVVFVHGFLDAQEIWGEVVDQLTTPGVELVTLDLPGMGALADAKGPFSLDRFAADVGAFVDALAKPFVIVGHSLGSQIAELVAAARPERAAGLVLISPVPLAGVKLPPEAVAPFRTLGGRSDQQRQVRAQLTSHLDARRADRLVAMGDLVRPPVVEALVDAWNGGHAAGEVPSRFEGPVLILGGADDPFVTAALVERSKPRFRGAVTVAVPAAGHWPHVEQASAVAAQIDHFLGKLTWPSEAQAVSPQGWTAAFAQRSATAFAATFDEDVILEATALTAPVRGRDAVKIVMEAASSVYERLVFTHEAVNGARRYLEWEATAFGGESLSGVTVLTSNEAGEITRACIHHRPLRGALRFSAELGRRLEGRIDGHFFHRP